MVVTWSGAQNVGVAGAVSFTGVNQSTPYGTHVTGSSDNGAPTVTVGSVGSGDIVVDTTMVLGASITVGTNQTSRVEFDNLGGNNESSGISTQLGSDGGVMSWTSPGSFWVIGAVNIKA